MTYLRLAIVGAGLADALVFDHITGAITALIVLGILESCAIADDRAKRRRAVEDELAKAVAVRAEEERRARRGW